MSSFDAKNWNSLSEMIIIKGLEQDWNSLSHLCMCARRSQTHSRAGRDSGGYPVGSHTGHEHRRSWDAPHTHLCLRGEKNTHKHSQKQNTQTHTDKGDKHIVSQSIILWKYIHTSTKWQCNIKVVHYCHSPESVFCSYRHVIRANYGARGVIPIPGPTATCPVG